MPFAFYPSILLEIKKKYKPKVIIRSMLLKIQVGNFLLYFTNIIHYVFTCYQIIHNIVQSSKQLFSLL